MSEKTLGQVLSEAWRNPNLDVERIAAAVIAEYERRRWKPIAEAPMDGTVVLVGRWARGEWKHKETGFVEVAIEDHYTHYCELPAAPEVENA